MTAVSRCANAILVLLLVVVAGGLIAVESKPATAGPIDPVGTPGPTDGVLLPGTPISALPLTITQPGHYYLTRSLSLNGATAITVSATDVSIDLGGFTLSGNDVGNAGIAVNIAGTARVRISNGTIRDFFYGIQLEGTDIARVSDVTLISNGVGANLGAAAVIEDCHADANNVGVQVLGAPDVIRNCTISGNTASGIFFNTGLFAGLVERSSVFGNNSSLLPDQGGIVLRANRVTVRDSQLDSNGLRDFDIYGSDQVIYDNVYQCPTWYRITGGVNIFLPVNSTDPHTNRTQKAACP